jgi:hypothetical protein
MNSPTIKDILFTADGISDKAMPTEGDIEAIRQERDELRKFKQLAAGSLAVLDEVHALLDLVDRDGIIHDLDQYLPDDQQSTLGSVLCELMHRLQSAEKAIHETVVHNLHLADGKDSTLSRLVAHTKTYPDQA